MPETLVISNEHIELGVAGSIRDGDSLTIVKDGIRTNISADPEEGLCFDEGGDLTVVSSGGSMVLETNNSQYISLEDGTKIINKDDLNKVYLPEKNGVVVQPDGSDTHEYARFEGEDDIDSRNEEETVDIEDVDEAKERLVNKLVPGFWSFAFAGYGLVSLSQPWAIPLIVVGIYFYISPLIRAAANYYLAYNQWTEKEMNEQGSDPVVTEDSFDVFSEMFAEGEITEEEFETLVEQEVEREEVLLDD